eukprot:4031078-Alexandrium_andersonii.AAC.1
MNAHRGIILEDHIAKLFWRTIYEFWHPQITSMLPDCQFGDGRFSGTAYAVASLRMFKSYAQARRLSWFVLFIDLPSAFDATIRQRVFPAGAGTPESLEALDLAPDVLRAVQKEIAEDGAVLDSTDIQPWCLDLLRSHHESSWVRPSGQEEAQRVASLRGVKQGDDPAAACFMADHASAVGRIRYACKQRGIGLTMPFSPNGKPWHHDDDNSTQSHVSHT